MGTTAFPVSGNCSISSNRLDFQHFRSIMNKYDLSFITIDAKNVSANRTASFLFSTTNLLSFGWMEAGFKVWNEGMPYANNHTKNQLFFLGFFQKNWFRTL